MFEYESNTANPATNDPLFLERLDAFMQKSLADIRIFADRESRPFEETRRSVAQLHANYLFQQPTQPTASVPQRDPQRVNQVRSALCNLSNALESLSETAGVQSFLLAVDPLWETDEGFLGGPVLGREFWRSLRGGGEAGARAFRTHCVNKMKMRGHPTASSSRYTSATSSSSSPAVVPIAPAMNASRPRTPITVPVVKPAPKGPARSIKSDLYESVRNSLREVSGVRGAEMKWTNPERLDVYDVRLVGWPKDIPSQNPSSLKVWQNKQLLEAVRNGTLRFERISGPSASGSSEGPSASSNHPSPVPVTTTVKEDQAEKEDFSWAYTVDDDDDARLELDADSKSDPLTSLAPVRSSLTPPGSTASSSGTSQVKYPSSTLPPPISMDDDHLMMPSSNNPDPDPWITEPVAGSTYSDFGAGYSWDEGLDTAVLSSSVVGDHLDDDDRRWGGHTSSNDDDDEDYEPPRKRRRSDSGSS